MYEEDDNSSRRDSSSLNAQETNEHLLLTLPPYVPFRIHQITKSSRFTSDLWDMRSQHIYSRQDHCNGRVPTHELRTRTHSSHALLTDPTRNAKRAKNVWAREVGVCFTYSGHESSELQKECCRYKTKKCCPQSVIFDLVRRLLCFKAKIVTSLFQGSCVNTSSFRISFLLFGLPSKISTFDSAMNLLT